MTPATWRLLIIEESDKLDTILDNYGLRNLVDVCAPAPEWSPLSVVA